MFLLVLFVVVTARSQEVPASLGDVARQNRAEKPVEPKPVLTDEKESAPAESTEKSACGPPIPLMQLVYESALLGQKTPPEEEVAKELLDWLNQHPELEKMDPEQLAKGTEPRTERQVQGDQDLANKIAQSLADEMVEFKKSHTDEEVQDRVAKLMSATMPQRQADVLASAVRDEKQRRAAAAGKPLAENDRLNEAVNLYAICENKRLIVSEGEVDRMSKEALKAKLNEAGFKVGEETVIGK